MHWPDRIEAAAPIPWSSGGLRAGFELASARGTPPVGCSASTTLAALRFIVRRILRELIVLVEQDADAELVDALHDALDVATLALSNGRVVTEPS